ncbi:3-methyl-2-oxobutanoate hydroxymethyltransferase [Sporomusa malonica]|uniref:3-methyl-2-oxobutanoate hydroxymethyltransferase n=1 Tax=Sporomusa malonica TaxID=112901 RepID=A0A1W1YFS3_9FIRM|nr:3-methyl-2-oxobutanoate hydroxymethyltransferase [Sporomusa malonica]SMC34976.1 ketopantoate hydroxymethyltransferase [Sporomusa malonica]
MAQKKTILDLCKMKATGEKAVWVTAYDCCFAAYAEKAGMDMILVGDSMGMVVYGYQGTIPVTMDMCINHCQAVRRGAPNTYIIGDMPFGSYHESVGDAVHNAIRFAKEADVDAIKLEGGVAVADVIKAIAQAGIVVFGHIGLTPQSSAAMGGFRAQGRTADSARGVIEDAIAVYEAGARAVLVEGVPEEVCTIIHKTLPIPVYGIGAGSDTDGQVLVVGDALGMFEAFKPKFAKRYADIASVATKAFAQFIKETKEGSFPASEHKYSISGDSAEFKTLFKEMEAKFKG